MTKYKLIFLCAFLIFTLLLCISPPYPEQLVLQHIPTVVLLLLLHTNRRLLTLSSFSYTLVMIFLGLHVIGARYIYSYVPYDEWCTSVFGFSLSEKLHTTRNHYDRLTHFSYGLLMVFPLRELLLRFTKASRTFINYVAVEFVMASSMIYELIEWMIAIVLSPESAEAYNGQQGDMWDAQKDMAFAACGAIIAITIIILRWRRELAQNTKK